MTPSLLHITYDVEEKKKGKLTNSVADNCGVNASHISTVSQITATQTAHW